MPNGIISLIIVLAAIAMLIFLILKNKKDRKSFTPESTDDPVEESKVDQQRDSEKE